MKNPQTSIDIVQSPETQTVFDKPESTNLRIRVVTTEEEFDSLYNEWDNLIEHSNAKIYQTYEWLSSWWKNYKDEKLDHLHCLLFYHNEILVGIAPLYVRYKYFLGFEYYRRIYFLGGDTSVGISFGLFFDEGPSDYLDIISLPEYEDYVAEALLLYFEKNKGQFNQIVLCNINSEGNTYRTLRPLLQNSSLQWKIFEGDECPYIQTPTSLEYFLKSRSASVRRRLTQSWKEVEEKSLFTLKEVKNTTDLYSAFSEMKRLHQNRWNRLGYAGFFGDPRYVKFFENVLQLFFARGWLWCKTTMTGNKCLAGRLAFKYKGEYYDYLSGIDDNAPEMKRRPGLVLLLAMIQDAVTEKAVGVDLLRGEEPYKKDFTSNIKSNWNIVITLNDGMGQFKIFYIHLLLVLKFLGFLLKRECKIIRVIYKNKLFPFPIIFFAKTRIHAFVKKIKLILKHNRNRY